MSLILKNCVASGSTVFQRSSRRRGPPGGLMYVMLVYGAGRSMRSPRVFVHHLIKVGAAADDRR